MTSLWMSSPTHRQSKPHVVAEVHFERGKPSDYARITCSCGWQNVVGAWSLHLGKFAVQRASTELEAFEV